MQMTKQVIEDISKTNTEVQALMPAQVLVDKQKYPVKKLSIVVFQGKGTCSVTITPLNGDKFTIDNMSDYRTTRLGGCALVQSGDSVEFFSYASEDSSAYMVAF